MARRRKRDHSKERFWRRTLRQWRRSGLSVRAFCAERGLAEPSFYAWRRIVAQRDQEAARVRTRPERRNVCHVARASEDAPVFVPLRVIDASTQVAFEVVLERGRVVRVLRGFDADTLRQLAAATPRRSGRGAAMLSLPLPVRVYLCLEPTDMRRSFDGSS